jgi:hypothetical protein
MKRLFAMLIAIGLLMGTSGCHEYYHHGHGHGYGHSHHAGCGHHGY